MSEKPARITGYDELDEELHILEQTKSELIRDNKETYSIDERVRQIKETARLRNCFYA